MELLKAGEKSMAEQNVHCNLKSNSSLTVTVSGNYRDRHLTANFSPRNPKKLQLHDNNQRLTPNCNP